MARPILSEYGPERTTGPASISGGVKETKDVRNYQQPTGPKNMGRGPGQNATVHKSGSQGSHGSGASTSGSPGIGGTRHSDGSQS